MSLKLARQASAAGPGLMRAEHFQMAYVTSDIAAARLLFGERMGVRAFFRLEGAMPSGGRIIADLAWAGPIMIELIEARGPGSALYMDRLPAGEGLHIRHHHLGYLVHDRAQWDGLIAEAGRQGRAIPYRNTNALLEACFVDAPELGHYLEYLFPNRAGLDFFDAVPRN